MWYEELFTQLELLGDQEQSKKMSAYMQNLFSFLGLPKPKLSAFMKNYLPQTKKQELDWSFVTECWKKEYREAQYIGMEYLMLHHKQLVKADLEQLEYLITHKSWWETTDQLDALVGELVEKWPELKDIMLVWSQSENIWKRRVSIDFQQRYKENTDSELLSQVIRNNLGTKEFYINKAIGWSLREYSKVNADWVRDFLKKSETELSALSKREATKYL